MTPVLSFCPCPSFLFSWLALSLIRFVGSLGSRGTCLTATDTQRSTTVREGGRKERQSRGKEDRASAQETNNKNARRSSLNFLRKPNPTNEVAAPRFSFRSFGTTCLGAFLPLLIEERKGRSPSSDHPPSMLFSLNPDEKKGTKGLGFCS